MEGLVWSWAHLEGAQEEVEEELDVAQGALGMLVRDEGEDHLVDAQQWDQRQCGLGQPARQVSRQCRGRRVGAHTRTRAPACVPWPCGARSAPTTHLNL